MNRIYADCEICFKGEEGGAGAYTCMGLLGAYIEYTNIEKVFIFIFTSGACNSLYQGLSGNILLTIYLHSNKRKRDDEITLY